MLETSNAGTPRRAVDLDANVRADMDQVNQARNLSIKAHKDPFEQAVIYNANNDVYEIFKVSDLFQRETEITRKKERRE